MYYFDLHADTPYVLDLKKETESCVDLINHPFERYNQVMAIFLKDNEAQPFNSYNRRVRLIKRYLERCNFPLVSGDFKMGSGAIFSVENASFLADDLNFLYTLKNDGVKLLSLTWNEDNLLASGANGNGGITPLGREAIREMNCLGLALDVSHLSHRAAMEGIELADKVLATHSALYSLNPHQRNLKNEHLLALKQKGGIVGICFYPLFLGGEDVFERIYNSIEHLISLGMEKNIALGSDFDGAEMAEILCKTKQVINLFDALHQRGLEKSLLNRVFCQNAIDFFDKICNN